MMLQWLRTRLSAVALCGLMMVRPGHAIAIDDPPTIDFNISGDFSNVKLIGDTLYFAGATNEKIRRYDATSFERLADQPGQINMDDILISATDTLMMRRGNPSSIHRRFPAPIIDPETTQEIRDDFSRLGDSNNPARCFWTTQRVSEFVDEIAEVPDISDHIACQAECQAEPNCGRFILYPTNVCKLVNDYRSSGWTDGAPGDIVVGPRSCRQSEVIADLCEYAKNMVWGANTSEIFVACGSDDELWRVVIGSDGMGTSALVASVPGINSVIFDGGYVYAALNNPTGGVVKIDPADGKSTPLLDDYTTNNLVAVGDSLYVTLDLENIVLKISKSDKTVTPLFIARFPTTPGLIVSSTANSLLVAVYGKAYQIGLTPETAGVTCGLGTPDGLGAFDGCMGSLAFDDAKTGTLCPADGCDTSTCCKPYVAEVCPNYPNCYGWGNKRPGEPCPRTGCDQMACCTGTCLADVGTGMAFDCAAVGKENLLTDDIKCPAGGCTPELCCVEPTSNSTQRYVDVETGTCDLDADCVSGMCRGQECCIEQYATGCAECSSFGCRTCKRNFFKSTYKSCAPCADGKQSSMESDANCIYVATTPPTAPTTAAPTSAPISTTPIPTTTGAPATTGTGAATAAVSTSSNGGGTTPIPATTASAVVSTTSVGGGGTTATTGAGVGTNATTSTASAETEPPETISPATLKASPLPGAIFAMTVAHALI